jgi:hypothetical protein
LTNPSACERVIRDPEAAVASRPGLIVGRFFHDAWRRNRTLYALTDQRVIIVDGGIQQRLRSLPLRTLPEISITDERAGRGTITFGSPTLPFGWFGGSGLARSGSDRGAGSRLHRERAFGPRPHP